MNGRLLRAFAQDWIGPGLGGLAGAALLIAAAEIGGLVAWLGIGLAFLALFGVMVWAVRAVYSESPFGEWDDEPPKP